MLKESSINNQKVVILNWEDINKFCVKLAYLIKESSYLPEIIVGIQRGGCIPAVLLSHLLNVENFCSLGIKTTKSEQIRSPRKEPIIFCDYSLEAVEGKNALKVDDVINTGTTLIEAKKRVIRYGSKDVKTAVMILDKIGVQKCNADYIGIDVNAWVIFPWENLDFKF